MVGNIVVGCVSFMSMFRFMCVFGFTGKVNMSFFLVMCIVCLLKLGSRFRGIWIFGVKGVEIFLWGSIRRCWSRVGKITVIAGRGSLISEWIAMGAGI